MLLLVIGLASCGGPGASALVRTPSPTLAPTLAPTLPRLSTPAASADPTPHQGEIVVVEILDAPSAEDGLHVVAVHIRGAVGSSAIFRSVEIRARTRPIEGSSCGAPPMASVLRPTHADAMQPALADQTRVAIVRSLGSPLVTAADGSSARFRYGPVPSLNGDFAGWVTFHVSAQADAADGYCAFDLTGVVTIVAGETTSRALPTVRIDTRDASP